MKGCSGNAERPWGSVCDEINGVSGDDVLAADPEAAVFGFPRPSRIGCS